MYEIVKAMESLAIEKGVKMVYNAEVTHRNAGGVG